MTPPDLPHRLAELDGRRITVVVPATSANLGAGYDCLAIALEMLNTTTVEVFARPQARVELTVEGEGGDDGELPASRENPFVVGLEAALTAATFMDPSGLGWRIAMRNTIPLSRGLGSSSAAMVGGLLAGNALIGEPLDREQLLTIATRLEGHPDNVAAALLGGIVVVDGSGPEPVALRFDPPRDLRAVLFIPERRLETRAMRAALPELVPLADAVANLGRVAIGVAGLASGRTDFLRSMTIDRLHEPYRASVYPELPRLVGAAREAGALGACLSGAGSTVIAFSDSMSTITRIEAGLLAVAGDADLPGRIEIVMPATLGGRVVESS